MNTLQLNSDHLAALTRIVSRMSKEHLIELLQRPDKRSEFINDQDQLFEVEDEMDDLDLGDEDDTEMQ